MLDNLLIALNTGRRELEDRKVQINEIESADGLSHFGYDPDLLMIHGQNVRFQARYRALYHGSGYFEITNYASVGPTIQGAIARATNCVVL